jgi:hypothetical protein
VSERTPEHMTDEQALEEYLKGGSSVSQRYRESAADVVPAHLDERVLALARAASTQRAKSRRWLRWTAPLAVAASALLALSVVLDQGAREHAAVSAVEAPSQLKPDSRFEERAANVPSAEHQPASPPQASKSEAPPAVRVPEASPAFVSPSDADRADEAEEMRASKLKQRVERESASVRRSEELAASTPAPRLAPEEAVVTSQARSIQGATSRAVSAVTTMDAASDDVSAPAAEVREADPELWLSQIRKLREQGKNEDADQEWKRFREAYPDYPVAESDVAKKKE